MIDINTTKHQPLNLMNKTPRILKCDGTEVPFHPKNGRAFDYLEIHEAIKGYGNNNPTFTMAGTIEDMMMVAEDNAIAMELPLNVKASIFYNLACGTKGDQWPILGNCLLMPKSMME